MDGKHRGSWHVVPPPPTFFWGGEVTHGVVGEKLSNLRQFAWPGSTLIHLSPTRSHGGHTPSRTVARTSSHASSREIALPRLNPRAQVR
jgi:hypothetical protein